MPLSSLVVRQSVSNFRLYCCSKKCHMLRKNVTSLLEQLQVCIFVEIVFGVRCTLTNIKMDGKGGQKGFLYGEVWNPVCCHGKRIVKLVLKSTFSRILLQSIKHFCYKLAEISLFIIFEQNLVECMTSSLG